ncbi:MAG: hypothetical protein ACLP5H_19940 [Desulfomonilaceae bacterium]
MSDQPLDDRQSANPQARSSQPSVKKNKAIPLKSIGVAVALAVGLALGYLLGVIAPATQLRGSSSSGQQLGPVFNRVPPDNLFSSTNLFQGVGGSPVDPSKILFPSLGKPPGAPEEREPQTGLPEQAAASALKTGPDARPLPEGGVSQPPDTSALSGDGPKPVGTPVIVTREPGQPAGEKEEKAQVGGKGAYEQPPGSKSPEWDTAPGPVRKKAGKAAAVRGPKEITPASPVQDKSQASEEANKREQFQLPGSLLVKIHNYSGMVTRWGLMVILDDSAVMARKTKPWTPSRSQAAESFVAKLAGHLTPGSKMAVRDFLCKQSEANKKQKETACLSHMLFEWTESPFAGLKEKLASVSPGGHNNPCAAAAYSLKKDFSGAGTLKPRVLLVTAGTAKCAVKEVVKAAEQHDSKDRIGVDVVAFGIGKKGQAGYSNLVKKSDGLLLKVDNPADVDSALIRYGKLLKARTVEKIEVRGERGVFNIKPEEEFTLPPGTYTVVLPVVAGLSPSKRIVPKVRITSEQTNVLDVRIKKGKPVIGFGKK